MKVKKKIILVPVSLVTIFVIGFFILYSSPVQRFGWKYLSGTQNILEDCFIYASSKCGEPDFFYSKKEILDEIEFLGLSKGETREMILNARVYDVEDLKILSKQENLSQDDKIILQKTKKALEFYERVLKATEE